MIAPAGAVTSRREYGRNGSASAAILHHSARFAAKTPRGANKLESAHLLRRADANRDQRRIRSAWHRAAGRASLAEKLCLIARRAAVSGDQDFIVLALHRTPRNAVRSDHPDTWAGRTWRAFFTLRAWRAGRPRRTGRTCIALGALRSGWALFALRTLAAASQAGEQRQRQRHCQRQGRRHLRHAHRHILPEKAAPVSPLRRSNPTVRRKANAGGCATVCLSCHQAPTLTSYD